MFAVAQFIECKIQQKTREQESYSENKPLRHKHNTAFSRYASISSVHKT